MMRASASKRASNIQDSAFGIRHSVALAVAAHPDDIEFVMAGTLLLLADNGWRIHYLNLSSGNLGSTRMNPAQTARVRRREAAGAAKSLGAVWHPPFCRDVEILYDVPTLQRLSAVIRDVAPRVILTHSPQDYMEDHMTTSRLTVTAAFVRGFSNFRSTPVRKAIRSPVTVYHASPHGLRDQLRRRIIPGAFVDTTAVHERKRAALACHASQREFLDVTQAMDSYLKAMDDFSRELGKLSGSFGYAEGWRRHSHLGFCEEEDDPLREALGRNYRVNKQYERLLEQGI
jgi:N-acetylglucosamine malate deacetylase 1